MKQSKRPSTTIWRPACTCSTQANLVSTKESPPSVRSRLSRPTGQKEGKGQRLIDLLLYVA